MQLAITLSQQELRNRRGHFKGVKFHLTYQLRASEEERALLDRYGLSSRCVIGKHDHHDWLQYTVKKLLDGGSHSGSEADSVLLNEKLIMKGAVNASTLLSQIAAFDGNEKVIDLAPGPNSDLE